MATELPYILPTSSLPTNVAGLRTYNRRSPVSYVTKRNSNIADVDIFGIKNIPINAKHLSNPTNGKTYTSPLDALMNTNAWHERWKNQDNAFLNWLDPETEVTVPVLENLARYVIRSTIDSTLFLKDSIYDPIADSIKEAKDNPHISMGKGVGAGATTALLNTLIGLGNTVDVLNNPVKGAFIEPIQNADNFSEIGKYALRGLRRATVGDSEVGRKIYDWSSILDFGDSTAANAGELATSIALEIISDPLTYIPIGSQIAGAAKSIGKPAAKIAKEVGEEIAEQGIKEVTQEVVGEAAEQTVKKATKEIAEEAVEQTTKTVAKEAVKEAVEETAEQTAKQTIKKFVTASGDDAVEAITVILRKHSKNATDDLLRRTAEALLDELTKAGKGFGKEAIAEALKGSVNVFKKAVTKRGVAAATDYDSLQKFFTKYLTYNGKIRRVANKVLHRGVDPKKLSRAFARYALADITLDTLPSAAKVSRTFKIIDDVVNNVLGTMGGKYILTAPFHAARGVFRSAQSIKRAITRAATEAAVPTEALSKVLGKSINDDMNIVQDVYRNIDSQLLADTMYYERRLASLDRRVKELNEWTKSRTLNLDEFTTKKLDELTAEELAEFTAKRLDELTAKRNELIAEIDDLNKYIKQYAKNSGIFTKPAANEDILLARIRKLQNTDLNIENINEIHNICKELTDELTRYNDLVSFIDAFETAASTGNLLIRTADGTIKKLSGVSNTDIFNHYKVIFNKLFNDFKDTYVASKFSRSGEAMNRIYKELQRMFAEGSDGTLFTKYLESLSHRRLDVVSKTARALAESDAYGATTKRINKAVRYNAPNRIDYDEPEFRAALINAIHYDHNKGLDPTKIDPLRVSRYFGYNKERFPNKTATEYLEDYIKEQAKHGNIIEDVNALKSIYYERVTANSDDYIIDVPRLAKDLGYDADDFTMPDTPAEYLTNIIDEADGSIEELIQATTGHNLFEYVNKNSYFFNIRQSAYTIPDVNERDIIDPDAIRYEVMLRQASVLNDLAENKTVVNLSHRLSAAFKEANPEVTVAIDKLIEYKTLQNVITETLSKYGDVPNIYVEAIMDEMLSAIKRPGALSEDNLYATLVDVLHKADMYVNNVLYDSRRFKQDTLLKQVLKSTKPSDLPDEADRAAFYRISENLDSAHNADTDVANLIDYTEHFCDSQTYNALKQQNQKYPLVFIDTETTSTRIDAAEMYQLSIGVVPVGKFEEGFVPKEIKLYKIQCDRLPDAYFLKQRGMTDDKFLLEYSDLSSNPELKSLTDVFEDVNKTLSEYDKVVFVGHNISQYDMPLLYRLNGGKLNKPHEVFDTLQFIQTTAGANMSSIESARLAGVLTDAIKNSKNAFVNLNKGGAVYNWYNGLSPAVDAVYALEHPSSISKTLTVSYSDMLSAITSADITKLYDNRIRLAEFVNSDIFKEYLRMLKDNMATFDDSGITEQWYNALRSLRKLTTELQDVTDISNPPKSVQKYLQDIINANGIESSITVSGKQQTANLSSFLKRMADQLTGESTNGVGLSLHPTQGLNKSNAISKDLAALKEYVDEVSSVYRSARMTSSGTKYRDRMFVEINPEETNIMSFLRYGDVNGKLNLQPKTSINPREVQRYFLADDLLDKAAKASPDRTRELEQLTRAAKKMSNIESALSGDVINDAELRDAAAEFIKSIQDIIEHNPNEADLLPGFVHRLNYKYFKKRPEDLIAAAVYVRTRIANIDNPTISELAGKYATGLNLEEYFEIYAEAYRKHVQDAKIAEALRRIEVKETESLIQRLQRLPELLDSYSKGELRNAIVKNYPHTTLDVDQLMRTKYVAEDILELSKTVSADEAAIAAKKYVELADLIGKFIDKQNNRTPEDLLKFKKELLDKIEIKINAIKTDSYVEKTYPELYKELMELPKDIDDLRLYYAEAIAELNVSAAKQSEKILNKISDYNPEQITEAILRGDYGTVSDVINYTKSAGPDNYLSNLTGMFGSKHVNTVAERAAWFRKHRDIDVFDSVRDLFDNADTSTQRQLIRELSEYDRALANAAVDNILNQANPAEYFVKTLSPHTAGRLVVSIPDSRKMQLLYDALSQDNRVLVKLIENYETGQQMLYAAVKKSQFDMPTTALFHNAVHINNTAVDQPALIKLYDAIGQLRIRQNNLLTDVGYSVGNVLNVDMVHSFDIMADTFGWTDKILTAAELNKLGYFDDALRANNMVIGGTYVQRLFDEYYSSDIIRRFASNLNYVDKHCLSYTDQIIGLFFDNKYTSINDCSVFNKLSNEQLIKISKSNPDWVCAYITNNKPRGHIKTKSGYTVQRIHLNNKADVAFAKKVNACFIPLDTYLEVSKAINTYVFTKPLRALSKVSKLYAIGYLSSIGVLFRNVLDSIFIKNTLSSDDYIPLPNQIKEYFSTIKMYMQYMDSMKAIGSTAFTNTKEYRVFYNYMTMDNALFTKYLDTLDDDARRFFNEVVSRVDKDKWLHKKFLEPEAFNVIDTFVKNGPSAGLARTIQQEFMDASATNFDILNSISRTKPVQFLFDVNENIEQIARLTCFLRAMADGNTFSEATLKVIRTHFDYSDKSLAQLYSEILFPFMSFTYKNLEYWVDTVEKNSKTIRFLENTFRNVFQYDQLFEADQDVYDNYDYSFDVDKDIIGTAPHIPYSKLNAARLIHILNGNLMIGSGKTVTRETDYGPKEAELYTVFKLSPSFLDAAKMLYTPLNTYEERLLPPYEVLIDIVQKALDNDGEELKEMLDVSTVINNLPFIDAHTQRLGLSVPNRFGEWKRNNNIIQRVADADTVGAIAQVFPSLFSGSYINKRKKNYWYDGLTDKILNYDYYGGFTFNNRTYYRLNRLYSDPNVSECTVTRAIHTYSRKVRSPYAKSNSYELRKNYYNTLTYNNDYGLLKRRFKYRLKDRYTYYI